jgi:hypothetical protein
MDISARATSLADRPQRAIRVTSVRMVSTDLGVAQIAARIWNFRHFNPPFKLLFLSNLMNLSGLSLVVNIAHACLSRDRVGPRPLGLPVGFEMGLQLMSCSQLAYVLFAAGAIPRLSGAVVRPPTTLMADR